MRNFRRLVFQPLTFQTLAFRHLAFVIACCSLACAAPVQRISTAPAPPGVTQKTPPREPIGSRPIVGIAFGGGSARGLAHVGVIRWFEEHRVPIDLAAGTSMGGLVGGAFASGMDAAEIDAMLAAIDWDEMFGASDFKFKNIRRKADARAYPTRLEFGLKRGIVPPPSLNNGEQVELLLSRIAAGTFEIDRFDDLPTPFRAVAVDLVSASEVVLDSGALSQAMRATMSLPLIFPPVERDGRVLVDGGALNNVPVDVVRAMGADRVVAINVGDLTNPEGISYTLTSLAGATLDAMMRASTKETIASADVVIDVPLKEYGSLDWRRGADLIKEGYQAAESMRDRLLPLAISEADYQRWREDRESRRVRALPRPSFVRVEGFEPADTRRLTTLLARHANADLNLDVLEADLAQVLGLDRYEAVTWRLVRDDAGATGLLVTGRLKLYAPPFMMLGLNLENTTSSDFNITATGRYLTYGLITSGSELRVDGTLGSNPSLGFQFYQPFGPTALFVAPYGGVRNESINSIVDDQIVARYGVNSTRLGLDAGVNLGRTSDVRVGAWVGHIDADVSVGDPLLPHLQGKETGAALVWRYDGQDSPVVPRGGLLANARLQRIFHGPDVLINEMSLPFDSRVTQFEVGGNQFWSFAERNRFFLGGGIGTSFDGNALPTNEFTLGAPLRLGAYRTGELRGDHYYLATTGYLRQVGRLPDFLGGPVFAGGWVDQGDAFDDWSESTWRVNPGFGIVMDTLVGPVMVAGSAGFDGRWRTYIGIGRIFGQ